MTAYRPSRRPTSCRLPTGRDRLRRQLAEQAGHDTPHRMQSLLGRAVWNAEAVRDELFGYGPAWIL
jgi:hypothetical protein